MMLNLATRPFVNRRRFYVLSTAAAIVLSLSTIVLGAILVRNLRSDQGTRREARKERDEIARLTEQQQRLETVFSQPRAADIIERTDFLNALIRQKAVSWTRIFMDLEKVMPNRVQTVALHPVVIMPGKKVGGKGGSTAVVAPASGPLYVDLQMTLSCESYENVLDVMHRLAQSPFYDPVPSNETPPGGANGAAVVGVASTAQDADKMFKLTLRVNYAQ